MDAELLLEAAPALPNQAQQPTLQHLEFVGDSRRILTLRYGWTDHGRLVNQPRKFSFLLTTYNIKTLTPGNLDIGLSRPINSYYSLY